jgi:hypothetical protein
LAESLLSVRSLGYLADRLARAIGWSPAAKTIRISSVEGPSASLFEGLTGTVTSFDENVMVLEPDRAACAECTDASRLRLTARHRGWTPFSMYFRPIVVVVESVGPNGHAGPVAIGTAAIVRPTPGSTCS